MSKPGDGLDRLARAIPDAVIAAIDPTAMAPTDGVRRAIAILTGTLLVVVIVWFVLRVLGGGSDLLGGRSLKTRTSGALWMMRQLAVIGLVAAPAYGLVDMVSTGRHNPGLEALWAACLFAWPVLRAGDRNLAWLHVDSRKLFMERGFLVGRITRTSVDLSRALIDASTRAPVGDNVSGRSVYVRRDAFAAIVAGVGDKQAAEQLVRASVARLGLVPAGKRFIASVTGASE